MANQINNRIFGGDIPIRVKKTLEARQFLSHKNRKPNEEISPSAYIDPKKSSYKFNELINFNFDGIADLSSRTPFVRLWCGIEVQKHIEKNRYKIENEKAEYVEKSGHIYVTEGNEVIEKEISRNGRIIYKLGNNNLNVMSKSPNERIVEESSENGTLNNIIPNIFESNDNEFLSPPAGIKSCVMETMGPLGSIKKTTIGFTVHNFHDFDKIYSKYFLKPGALLFVDFGWDTANLYDPESLIFDDKNGGKSLEEILYGETGNVTLSNGDLETLVGYVTDYDAKILDNGSVECSVDIMSKNSALINHDFTEDLGLRNRIVSNLDTEVINFASKYFKLGVDLLKPDWNANPETEEDWVKVAEKFASANLSSTDSNIPSEKNVITGVYWQSIHLDDKKLISNSKNTYVSWGFFEDKILSSELGIDKNLDDILFGENLSVRFDSSNSFVRYDKYLLERQKASTDATGISFLYPDNWNKTYNTINDKVPFRGDDIPSDMTSYDVSRERIPFREIFISLDTIKRSFRQNTNVRDVISYIVDEINSDSFDVFNLSISTGKIHSSEISIIDKNIVHEDKPDEEEQFFENLFMFKPLSPSSIVKGYDIQFTTPKGGLQNMIAIQTMSPGKQLFPFSSEIDKNLSLKISDSPQDTNTQTGTVYLPEIGVWAGERFQKNSTIDTNLDANFISSDKHIGNDKTKEEFLNTLSNSFQSVGNMSEIRKAIEKAENPEEDVDDTKEEKKDDSDDMMDIQLSGNVKVASTLEQFWGFMAKRDFYVSKLSTIIPISLRLDIYGISSLVPGDIFRVDYLPERYRDSVYFQITKIMHSVTSSTWTTSIECIMRLRNIKKKDSGMYQIPKEVFINRKIFTDLKLSRISEFMTLMTKVKVLSDRPKMPSFIDYYFTFVGKKHGEIKIEPATWDIGKTVPTIDDNQVTDSEKKAMTPNKQGFTSEFEKVVSVKKGFENVYDYGYTLQIKEGEEYKMVVSGNFWIAFPTSFGESELKAFDRLFELGEGLRGLFGLDLIN